MRVLTYLGFTVISLVIQLCVMDYIQEKIQLEDKQPEDPHVNNSIKVERKESNAIISDLKSKPHALYYRNVKGRPLNAKTSKNSTNIYGNSSLPETPLSTTEVTATILDVLYDEDTAATDLSTTELYYTSTEFDNATEITFFETMNGTSNVSNTTPKPMFNGDCVCNLLYQVCDINCCCDNECTDTEHNMFYCDKQTKVPTADSCLSNFMGHQRYGSSMFDSLFCVVKTNLPEKRIQKKYIARTHQYYQWQNNGQPKVSGYKFEKTAYKQSDPIWLLKNGTVYYLDVATTMINYYCDDRAPIRFLKDESLKCNVKLRDLEMFHIINNSEVASIISATEQTFNSSVMNCTTLHCTNWSILVCDTQICTQYNKSLHEASCTDSICMNMALKIDYIFYYSDSKIVNSTIKLHIRNVPNNVPFMSQEINVKFVMADISEDHIVRFSGNPGYLSNRPIIVSYAESNHTENFFNTSSSNEKRMILFPVNKNGLCTMSNVSNNVVMFGLNKRTKCRFVYAQNIKMNSSDVCKNVQDSINELIGLDSVLAISPFGNPYNVADDTWIKLERSKIGVPLYGEYKEDSSKLFCHNLVTRILVVFNYASGDEKYTNQNKIVAANIDAAVKNVTFNPEDVSTVITIDINFVDVSKPNNIEYARSPGLDIHLPKDFFFPFPSNKSCSSNKCLIFFLICSCVMVLFSNKISFE